MSFLEFHEDIRVGDTVIIFMGRNSMIPLKVERGKILQTTYGAFPHNDLVGKKFGSKMFSKNNKGWAYLLYPTPELWTLTLPHRTQILYTTDISMVILQLDIKPGTVVIESGTGSGSMSHSMIRAIAPHGHLYTFEFHEQRADKAREEFEEHGLSNLVTVEHRDVLKEGFGLTNIADAVFLDLPSPWDAIQSAKSALKMDGGRLCSFSPCIEQVQRTCDKMRKLGFEDITVMENLLKTFDVRTIPMQKPYLGPTQDMEINKTLFDDEPPAKKLKVDAESEVTSTHTDEIKKDVDSNSRDLTHENGDEILLESKVVKEQSLPSSSSSLLSTETNIQHSTKVSSTGFIQNAKTKQLDDKINILTARAFKDMPGHTGFLTFGTLYPVRNKYETSPIVQTS